MGPRNFLTWWAHASTQRFAELFQRKCLDPQHLHRLADAAGHTHELRLMSLRLEESERERVLQEEARKRLESELGEARMQA